MPRAGLDRATVIAAASELADEVGFARLTMGLPAEPVDVRAPSLYKHVDSPDALHRGVGLQAVRDIDAVRTRAAVDRSGPEMRAEAAIGGPDRAPLHAGEGP